ncbi:hypothetical protein [Ideonella sp. YS5]|uniref:hypothetical protein n=1 Tax=Ideonella sp. YS5 TaxID=3453714 RepID=UPI003EE9C508
MSKLLFRVSALAAVSITALSVQASALAIEILWDQRDGDSGIGISSQNFEASFDIYDTQSADDFIVPTGETWVIKTIEVIGNHFSGTQQPIRSMRVTLYRNRAERPGRPGAVLHDFPEAQADPLDCVGCGSYLVHLSEPVELHQGRHWLGLQANLDYQNGGQWGWEASKTRHGRPAVWRNPGGGFATGCADYQRMLHCIGDLGQGADFLFALHGKRRAPNQLTLPNSRRTNRQAGAGEPEGRFESSPGILIRRLANTLPDWSPPKKPATTRGLTDFATTRGPDERRHSLEPSGPSR